MRGTLLLIVVACVFAPASAQEEDARALVSRANAAFAGENYQAALDAYREAEVTHPESPELAYNQGVAQFKLGDYDAAKDAFSRALRTRDLALEAKIKFNLGDVAYASALEKMSNPQEAIDLLKAAMGRYRDAIALDPEDEDARTNIEMSQLLIKDLLDKLKKEQEEQQQGQQNQQGEQDQEKQNQEKQDQQEGDQQDQQDGDPDQKGEQQKDEEQKQNGDQQQQQQQLEQQEQEPGDEQQQKAGKEMTEEEADRLLQAVRDKERQRRDEKARRVRARRVPVLKDW